MAYNNLCIVLVDQMDAPEACCQVYCIILSSINQSINHRIMRSPEVEKEGEGDD
jgi:hypothetical protein